MRYYSIEIEGGRKYTSHPSGPSGRADPGALLVEMDMFTLPQAAASVNSWLRIWGIPLEHISQAFDLNLKGIKVFGGMGKGLPLANPSQAGLLVNGSILQAFGNWIGTDMTLDMFLGAQQTPDLKTAESPRNLAFNWKEGTTLKDAIQSTLTQAFPGYKVDINIKDNLVLSHDEPFYYDTLPQFSQFVKGVSKDIVGPNYMGVDVVLEDKTFKVFDGSVKSSPKSISFTDLIGQPTWLEPLKVSVTCVMRADIKVGDFIRLPETQVTTMASQKFVGNAGASAIKQSSIFKGAMLVTSVHHVGNSRTPDGRAWTTIYECALTGSSDVGPAASASETAPIPPGGMTTRPVPWNS